MTKERFLELYNAYNGEDIVYLEWLTMESFTGMELYEFCKFIAEKENASLQKENAQLQKSWDDLAELNGSKILEISELQKENEILILEKELLETKLQQSESIWKDEKTGLGNIIAELEAKLKELKGE